MSVANETSEDTTSEGDGVESEEKLSSDTSKKDCENNNAILEDIESMDAVERDTVEKGLKGTLLTNLKREVKGIMEEGVTRHAIYEHANCVTALCGEYLVTSFSSFSEDTLFCKQNSIFIARWVIETMQKYK